MKMALLLVGLSGAVWSVSAVNAAGPYQATGIKIGEVDDRSAIVWTRLTLRGKANSGDAPGFEIKFADGKSAESSKSKKHRGPVKAVKFPKGMSAADIHFAAPGAKGETRVLIREKGEGEWQEMKWGAVDPAADFTRQVKLEKLKGNTRYEVRVESRDGDGTAGQAIEGGFLTAPAAGDAERVRFVVTTGSSFPDRDGPHGYDTYAGMLKLEPSFFVHTGDIVYYDRLAKTVPLAHWHWQRMYALPSNVDFHRQVASYFIKDDHETWTNDCWPGMKANMFEFSFDDGLRIFREQVPMGKNTHRTRRWGKDLQVWMVEGRDFRSANTMEDGPEKTIWGAEQMAWFKKSVRESDATFRILISPTPVVGPDRDGKNDNHSNKGFSHEGDELRKFLAEQENMFVVCGDRHWQYHSVHPGTGVREYSCGPISEAHAGGWKQEDYRKDYHKYLNVRGGFLSVTVDPVSGKRPLIAFRFHDPKAKEVLFERVYGAE